ncbi:hypothetical protein NA56DRAFT_747007, partial [Hyaloscypha hepaticicola]
IILLGDLPLCRTLKPVHKARARKPHVSQALHAPPDLQSPKPHHDQPRCPCTSHPTIYFRQTGVPVRKPSEHQTRSIHLPRPLDPLTSRHANPAVAVLLQTTHRAYFPQAKGSAEIFPKRPTRPRPPLTTPQTSSSRLSPQLQPSTRRISLLVLRISRVCK